MTYRGIVKGRVVELEGGASIPDGTQVEIVVREGQGLRKGSPKLLVQVAKDSPHLGDEDVTALEQAIEEGKLAVCSKGVFEGEGK